MNCPVCNQALEAGETYFKKSATDFAAFGLGSENLRMKTDTGKDLFLLAPPEKAAAQFCHECGVVVIATERGRRSAARKIK